MTHLNEPGHIFIQFNKLYFHYNNAYCNHPVCSLHIHHCLVWIGHQTGREQTTTGSRGKSLVPTCPPFRTYTCPESGNGQETSLQIHHTPDICSNFLPLVGTTELCVPKQHIRTVSSLRPSL